MPVVINGGGGKPKKKKPPLPVPQPSPISLDPGGLRAPPLPTPQAQPLPVPQISQLIRNLLAGGPGPTQDIQARAQEIIRVEIAKAQGLQQFDRQQQVINRNRALVSNPPTPAAPQAVSGLESFPNAQTLAQRQSGLTIGQFFTAT